MIYLSDLQFAHHAKAFKCHSDYVKLGLPNFKSKYLKCSSS